MPASLTKALLFVLCIPLLAACGSASASEAVPSPIPTAPPPAPTATIDPNVTPEPTEPPVPPTFTPAAGPVVVEEDVDALTAQQVYDRGMNNLGLLDAYTYEETMYIELPAWWTKETWEQTCHYQNAGISGVGNNTAYCISSVKTQFNDMPVEPEVTEWMRFGDELWTRKPGHEWEQLENISDSYAQNGLDGFSVNEYTEEIESFREGSMDGIPVYELKIGVDMKGYLEQLVSDEVGDVLVNALFKENTNSRYWIGVEDEVLRRMQVKMSYEVDGEEIRMFRKADITNIGNPQELPYPFNERAAPATQVDA